MRQAHLTKKLDTERDDVVGWITGVVCATLTLDDADQHLTNLDSVEVSFEAFPIDLEHGSRRNIFGYSQYLLDRSANVLQTVRAAP